MAIPTKSSLRYELPRAENYLQIIMANIHQDLRTNASVVVRQPPILQRANTIVNEIGVLPYQDYNTDVELLESYTS